MMIKSIAYKSNAHLFATKTFPNLGSVRFELNVKRLELDFRKVKFILGV
jgi:hypothetical protein